MFGILNVNKPAGCTSRDVVNQVQRLVRPVKTGHAGTLDPLAEGVLVICVGQATRLIEYVQQMPKTYEAVFLLGRASESEDTETEVFEWADPPQPTLAAIEQAIPAFVGEIDQRPPAFSALKIGGKRAYELARQGRPVELKSRRITIYGIEILGYAYPELRLRICCGSGTYVRSLGRDIATALGTAAVMSALRRTEIGVFRVETSFRPDDLTSSNIGEHLLPAVSAVSDLARLSVTAEEIARLHNGMPIASRGSTTGIAAAVDSSGQLASIVEHRQGEIWPVRNFHGS